MTGESSWAKMGMLQKVVVEPESKQVYHDLLHYVYKQDQTQIVPVEHSVLMWEQLSSNKKNLCQQTCAAFPAVKARLIADKVIL